MAPKRERADVLLVERGLVESRARAQALILAGEVRSGEKVIAKPGELVGVDAALEVTLRRRFVSRGGDKLDGALAHFGARFADLKDVVAVDVGASTGGFTDCLLQRGAARVFAIDVGYGQLDDRLRRDARVDVRERTNARGLTTADFDAPIDLVVIDASFIGLDKLVPAIASFIKPGGDLVALVKPQFEAGAKEAARNKGVILDEAVRTKAIAAGRDAITRAGFVVVDEVDSALHGPKGNRERFIHARRIS